MKNRQLIRAAALLALASASSIASAQASRGSSASVGLANLDYAVPRLALDYQSTITGDPITASVLNQSFSGMDSAGDNATMHFSAMGWGASPEFGRMQAVASGELTDSFYRSDNPPYFDATQDPPLINPNGVPDFVYSYGSARFTDILSYGGFSGTRNVRYIFHIDGQLQGDGFARAILQFTVNGSTPEFWEILPPPAGQNQVVIERGTEAYSVTGQTAQTVQVVFVVWYEADLQDYAEGSDIIGEFDFSSTAKLERIEMTDQGGNIVTDWTLQAESGTVYPTGPGDKVFADGFESAQIVNVTRARGENCAQIIKSITRSAALPTKPQTTLACAPNAPSKQ